MATDALLRMDGLFQQFDRDEITASELRMLFNKEIEDATEAAKKTMYPDQGGGSMLFVQCGKCRGSGHMTSSCGDTQRRERNRQDVIEICREIIRRYPLEYHEKHFKILCRGLKRHPTDDALKKMHAGLKKKLDENEEAKWVEKLADAEQKVKKSIEYVQECKERVIKAEKAVIDEKYALKELKEQNVKRMKVTEDFSDL